MALVTTVSPATIAVALGQAAPTSGSVTEQRWQMWIDDALMLVQVRLDQVDSTLDLDQSLLDYVIKEAVAAHATRPEDVTQVSVSIDDASTQKTYRSGRGRVTILDEWWALLGLAGSKGHAFEIDTMPDSAGVHLIDYQWITTTDTAAIP